MFEVLGEPPVAVQPCQRPLDDPAPGQHLEAFRRIGPLDDRDGPFTKAAQGVLELVSGVASIGEDMAQPREAPDDFSQHQRRAVAVLNVGSVDHGMNEITLGVGKDMALASLHLLARVIATRPAAFRGFHALAVDHAGARRSLPAVRRACNHQQSVIDRQPQPVVAPKVEPVPHSRNGRKARRQHPPGQAAAQQV